MIVDILIFKDGLFFDVKWDVKFLKKPVDRNVTDTTNCQLGFKVDNKIENKDRGHFVSKM